LPQEVGQPHFLGSAIGEFDISLQLRSWRMRGKARPAGMTTCWHSTIPQVQRSRLFASAPGSLQTSPRFSQAALCATRVLTKPPTRPPTLSFSDVACAIDDCRQPMRPPRVPGSRASNPAAKSIRCNIHSRNSLTTVLGHFRFSSLSVGQPDRGCIDGRQSSIAPIFASKVMFPNSGSFTTIE